MAEPRVKYFQFPTFSAADWTDRNPVLRKGEIGVELGNDTKPEKMKIGNGSTAWNDLEYMEFSYWVDTTPVTNPIGDATGNLSGLSDREILNLMLNPYVAPAFSGVQNNAGGTYAGTNTLEIGNTVSGTVTVQYSITEQASLVGATPINITAGGIFSNEGDFAVGSQGMTLASPLTPTSIQTYTITLVATHINGTVQATTLFRFYPRMLWMVTQSDSAPSNAEWAAAANGGYAVTNDFTRDITFSASGYHWLAIPSMLSPGTPTFTDVTDPNAPAGYGMNSIGQQTINNGVTSYNYETWRSTFSITQSSSILRIS